MGTLWMLCIIVLLHMIGIDGSLCWKCTCITQGVVNCNGKGLRRLPTIDGVDLAKIGRGDDGFISLENNPHLTVTRQALIRYLEFFSDFEIDANKCKQFEKFEPIEGEKVPNFEDCNLDSIQKTTVESSKTQTTTFPDEIESKKQTTTFPDEIEKQSSAKSQKLSTLEYNEFEITEYTIENDGTKYTTEFPELKITTQKFEMGMPKESVIDEYTKEAKKMKQSWLLNTIIGWVSLAIGGISGTCILRCLFKRGNKDIQRIQAFLKHQFGSQGLLDFEISHRQNKRRGRKLRPKRGGRGRKIDGENIEENTMGDFGFIMGASYDQESLGDSSEIEEMVRDSFATSGRGKRVTLPREKRKPAHDYRNRGKDKVDSDTSETRPKVPPPRPSQPPQFSGKNIILNNIFNNMNIKCGDFKSIIIYMQYLIPLLIDQ